MIPPLRPRHLVVLATNHISKLLRARLSLRAIFGLNFNVCVVVRWLI